jgi:ERCC4-related helicase
MLTSADQVRSDRFGLGRVMMVDGPTAVVKFEHGVEVCEVVSLRRLLNPVQACEAGEWHTPLDVLARCQAEAIRSVNDTWGVFARSRIALLPHQLWVCRQVLQSWPTRWLVADDVGLGKTIEAGLILMPLLARGDVKRLLILCPASLVEQWQERLRLMFDIRLASYTPEADTARSDFWYTHPRVVASLQTLRLDHNDRQERLLNAPPWDLVVVDEAHHLNADQERGPTLGYKLLQRLDGEGQVASMVFFTGTPHRGDNFGFLSLLKLLKPDVFNPRQPLAEQLVRLRHVMIRNNKQNVTDLRGNRLFQAPKVTSRTYDYSKPEDRFYAMLTHFIASGKAYASTLSQTDGRAVILVLIAMQKLASSSVAAIRRALRNRLSRIVGSRQRLEDLEQIRSRFRRYEEEEALEGDGLNRLEEEIAALSDQVQLMADEEPRLKDLIDAAEQVTTETKVQRILDILEGPFVGRPVLFFTEYKATQSLLMSALLRKYGPGVVAFINGDDRAEEVSDGGPPRTLQQTREDAASQFNSGRVRFLVSTEAGGEGIDLQKRCHSLIHVDLPWNPMRLHQRVGRLNRYGQTCQVEVYTLRNPATVESRIWDKLNSKIDQITVALGSVMDEPEDLLQLVLGMTSPSLFRELFGGAEAVPPERLSDWFNEKTAQFGGQDVLRTVHDLVGHCARFDFQQVSDQIPQLDLPDLRPFFTLMLERNHRRVQEEEGGGISFKTPDAWVKTRGVRPSYKGLVFEREAGSEDTQRVLGVGNLVFDLALEQGRGEDACLMWMPADALGRPLCIFRVSDQVTSSGGSVRYIVVGVEADVDGKGRTLSDWELLRLLNRLAGERCVRGVPNSAPRIAPALLEACVGRGREVVRSQLLQRQLPFRHPVADLMAVIWSGSAESS